MRRAFVSTDVASLAALRVFFGALMLVAVVRYFANGWIDALFIRPRVFFPYEGFEWVVPWPGWGMYAHYVVLGGAAAGILFGLFYRASAVLFCAGFTYAHLIDKSLYLNHYYLISLVAALLCFMPLGRCASLDVSFRGVRPVDAVPVWMIWVLRFQLAVVYVFSALAKVNGDWLLRAQPMRIWLAARTDTPVIGWAFEWSWVAFAMSWAGFLFDLLIVPSLLWRRSRPYAYILVVVFHIATALLFPIGIFPWLMIALTTVFFSPDWPRRLLPRWGRRSGPEPVLPRAVDELGIVPRWTTAALLAAYITVQLVVPMRPLWREGPLFWTEEGFRFGWRVMLMEKQGRVEIAIRDSNSKEAWSVDPASDLTPLQVQMMATQPDMIRFFARWLAAEWAERGHRYVTVHATAPVSLNGRPHQLLVDPDVDLAHLPDDAPAASWLVPLRSAPAASDLVARQ